MFDGGPSSKSATADETRSGLAGARDFGDNSQLAESLPAVEEESPWWDQPAPRVEVAAPARDEPVPEHQAQMDRKRARGAVPVEASEAVPGSRSTDASVDVGTLSDADRESDQMRHFGLARRGEQSAELAALGGGRAPGYRGSDEVSADARAMVEDPRFAQHYSMDGKKAGLGAKAKAKLSKMNNEKAARAARMVPLANIGLAGAGAAKEHDRMKVNADIAADEENDILTRNMASGLELGHRRGRNNEIVNAGVGAIKTGVAVATGGVSGLVPDMGLGEAASAGASRAGGSLLSSVSSAASDITAEKVGEKAAWKAGKVGARKGVRAADDAYHGSPSPTSDGYDADLAVRLSSGKQRRDAVAPGGVGQANLIKAHTDSANESLMGLAASDPKFSAGMLDHLQGAALDVSPADDRPSLTSKNQAVFDSARGADPRKPEEEHTLRPSQVARLADGETARDRQKARMGETLATLDENEDKAWWEKGKRAKREDG